MMASTGPLLARARALLALRTRGVRVFSAQRDHERECAEELSPAAACTVGELCRVLSDHRAPHHELEPALAPFASSLSPAILDHVLKRCSRLPISTHRFFLWASRLPHFSPSPNSYSILISILGTASQFPLIWDLLAEIRDTPRGSELIRPEVLWLLFRAYARAGLANDAVRAFNRMHNFGLIPGLDDLHQLLSALCRHNLVAEAQDCFDKSKAEFPINQKTYTILMDGCSSVGHCDHAVKLFDEMVARGLEVDVVAYNTMMASLCKGGKLDEAYKKLQKMRSMHGLEPDAATYAVFIRASCEAKDVHSCVRLLDQMRRRGIVLNVFTYNCVIKLLCEKEEVEEAYELLNEMIEKGAKPDAWSYNAILAVHCKLKEVNKALRLLARMDKDSCLPDRHTYNMLLKMLIGIGRMDRVVEIWDGMKARGFYPSAPSYAVMIHGLCGKKGWIEEACKHFEMMVDEGIPPYLSTCELLKSQLLHLGLQERVGILFDKMRLSTSCTIRELANAMEGRKRVEDKGG